MLLSVQFPAPSAAPFNISVSELSPSLVELTWAPPPPEERNGVINHYQIQVYEAESNDSLFFLWKDILEESSPTVLQDLHPNYHYQINISAVTVEPGPFSDTLSWRMSEDGIQELAFR